MDGTVIIGTELDTKSFDEEIRQTENKLNRLVSSYEKASNMKGKMKPNEEAMANLRLEIEKTTNKLIQLKQKQDDLNRSNLSQMPTIFNNVGSSMDNIIRKATKWGLAIFGIRNIYSLISSSIGTLAGENEQIATDLEYISWIMAQTLKPVVEWIIKGLYLVISLVNMIFSSIFGINLLAGKGANEFKKMKKSTGGVTKDLKEAKKQLAGFDEMNVLQDNESAGGGGGGGADLPNWEPPDMGKFENQIKKIGKEWNKFGKSMKDVLKNVPLDVWFKAFGQWGLAVRGVTQYVYGLWSVITGMFEFVKGIIDIIKGIITGDTELIKQGIITALDGLWNVIDGFINMVLGTLQLAIGLIIGIVGTLVKAVWDILKGAATWIYDNIITPIGNWVGDRISDIIGFVDGMATFIENIATTIGNWIGDRISDIIGFIKNLGKNIENVSNSIKEWVGNKINDIVNFFKNAWSTLKSGIKTAIEWVKGIFNGIVSFFSGIVGKIFGFFQDIGSKVGDIISGAFKGVVNGVLGAVETILNAPIRAINSLIDAINTVPGVDLKPLNTFKLPRLAKGGIINMPGRGVPIGGAIAGEKGQEGVIPLTDSQQMELLGESIGKYININATIPIYVGNRQIARELRKVEAEDSFAFNR